MAPRPHDRFSATATLTPAEVAAFARAAGDTNPVHHDQAYAEKTRFGRLLASGTQTSAMLLGLAASHFSTGQAMLGIEFWLRFRRPIYADETITLEWLVVEVTEHERSGGRLVDLRGRIRGEDGRTSLGAKGLVLVTDSL
jgi:3-hydroxybutyryl-CoA dehydratase